LMPNGQFGTRLQGGKDSASERYIFTMLNKITRCIFPVNDDNVLEYLNDDGLIVEPVFYAPIIPMILVNGSKGIGTGFSTDVMCYNPLDIIKYLKDKLNGNPVTKEFIPYYDGFKGTISKIDETNTRVLIKGVYEKVATDKIRVTELPIGTWTEDFKELLEKLIEPEVNKDGKKAPAVVKDYDDMSKDTNVDFTITFTKGKLDELEASKCDYGCNGLEKLLKLYTTNTNTNMHLFNAAEKLHKYDNVSDIIDEYYVTRLNIYGKRKDFMINAIQKDLLLLSNKARYITEILEDTIDLRKKKKDEVVNMLTDKKYDVIDNDGDYKYLTKMPMDSVTEENVARLYKEHGNKEHELKKLMDTTINDMWLGELDKLRECYLEYKEERERLNNGEVTTKKQPTKKAKKMNLIIV